MFNHSFVKINLLCLQREWGMFALNQEYACILLLYFNSIDFQSENWVWFLSVKCFSIDPNAHFKLVSSCLFACVSDRTGSWKHHVILTTYIRWIHLSSFEYLLLNWSYTMTYKANSVHIYRHFSTILSFFFHRLDLIPTERIVMI